MIPSTAPVATMGGAVRHRLRTEYDVSMTSEPRGPLPRAIVILLGLAALVIVIAGMQSAAWLLGPASWPWS